MSPSRRFFFAFANAVPQFHWICRLNLFCRSLKCLNVLYRGVLWPVNRLKLFSSSVAIRFASPHAIMHNILTCDCSPPGGGGSPRFAAFWQVLPLLPRLLDRFGPLTKNFEPFLCFFQNGQIIHSSKKCKMQKSSMCVTRPALAQAAPWRCLSFDTRSHVYTCSAPHNGHPFHFSGHVLITV